MLASIAPIFGYADTVLDFHNSGAGPIDDEPYGGDYDGFSGTYPVPIELTAALGADPGPVVDFVSLPTGSHITVGFLDEVVIDGAGDDIFVTEVANNSEAAEVFVSSNGVDFVLLGEAGGGTTASFDLADIGFKGIVTAVKIVGLDANGGSPGFDVVNVRVVGEGSGVDLSEDNDLEGSGADDVVDLQGGDDVFDGRGGDDHVDGGAGKDKLSGGKGRDALSGDGGRDKLWGGGGKDEIDGGAGNDKLWGGAKADRFVFESGDGRDKVMDFAGRDRIDLRGHDEAGGFRALKKDFADVKAGVKIGVGDDAIVLVDVEAQDLDKGDFLL
ncbi:calcium-binding protein [uncultured Albimonas sp.]|uniref:calcium-binding protein n=1 Tax=uncultured Albimonas sp. TaxID=1331701 RepID=UPI0030ED40FA|tara:strand:- start:1024 stop:2007 length:984 start_codon:yes stop_codon:yes gene_type:complete